MDNNTKNTHKNKSIERKKHKLDKKGKTILISVLSSVIVVGIIIALCLNFLVFNKKNDYFRYYNNFSSQQFTKAECIVNLSEGTIVKSYDATEGVFITAREYLNEFTTRYGLATEDGEVLPTSYHKILQINGDYALVVREKSKTSEILDETYIDLIRFRGAPDTPYSMMANYSKPYSEEMATLVLFDEYIACYGELTNTTISPEYATFYDYKSGNELLEKFKIRSAYDFDAHEYFNFVLNDGYLAAYSKDRAFFYDTNLTPIKGYLEPERQGVYTAFPEMQETISLFERETKIYYMGNGWFARSAMIAQDEPFQGFNIRFDNGKKNGVKYARTKTDFYNIKYGQNKVLNDIYCIAGVANKYTKRYYSGKSYQLGSIHIYDDKTQSYEYNLPFANPANMIKDGYSIVYYYYLPYVEDYATDTEKFLGYTGETTHCILDENLKVTQPSNALMPTAYIDGFGIQNSDPEYSEVPGSAYVYDSDMNSTTLAQFHKGKAAYIPYYTTKEGCIIRATLKKSNDEVEEKYGAITNDGKRITDFSYDELSYFSGGYAIGGKRAEGKKNYYQISKEGKEKKLEDVIVVYQGVYSYSDGAKVGLKNYAGETIIEPIQGSIAMSEIAMTSDNQAMLSYAIVEVAGRVKIYKLR